MTVAYLVNQYPKPSHSFIRREIVAVEAHGVKVYRFSIRDTGHEAVDEADKAEAKKTRAIMSVGVLGLLAATLKMLFRRPVPFCRATAVSVRMGFGGDRGVLFHLAYLAEACVLIPWLEEAGAHHVHAHFGTNSTNVAMLCHLLGGPTYSFTVHGPDEFDRPKALRLREKIAKAKFVIGISNYGRSQLYRWANHCDWPKIHVVHCGVDAMFLSPNALPRPITASTPARLINVGRLVPAKGQLLLVQAAAKLKAEGREFELVLVGDGPLRQEIETLSRTLGLNGCVRITGMVSNERVRHELLDSRALVLPSFAEGLPVVVMESLAMHRPVVTTQIAGIPELVQPGVCGWLVPAGSIAALVDAMREVLNASPESLAMMGEIGAARVAQRHDAMTEADQLVSLFRGEQAGTEQHAARRN